MMQIRKENIVSFDCKIFWFYGVSLNMQDMVNDVHFSKDIFRVACRHTAVYPPWERHFHRCASLVHPRHPERGLTNSKPLVSICWINKWIHQCFFKKFKKHRRWEIVRNQSQSESARSEAHTEACVLILQIRCAEVNWLLSPIKLLK